MYKKIITALSLLIVLIGAVFAGIFVLKTYPSNNEQTVSLTEQEESSLKQSEDLNPDIKTTEENIINHSDEPEEMLVQESAETPDRCLICTLSVNCSSVLENIDNLKGNKKELIPKDGIILKETKVEFLPDESVFDVLYRELKNNNIHFEFVKTPAYNSVYIEGIANLYEFDCGELSGWLYKVNGVQPTYGSSQYKLKNNDRIEFFYSCNMFK